MTVGTVAPIECFLTATIFTLMMNPLHRRIRFLPSHFDNRYSPSCDIGGNLSSLLIHLDILKALAGLYSNNHTTFQAPSSTHRRWNSFFFLVGGSNSMVVRIIASIYAAFREIYISIPRFFLMYLTHRVAVRYLRLLVQHSCSSLWTISQYPWYWGLEQLTWWLGKISESASTTFSLRPAAKTIISAMSSGVNGSHPL